MAKRRTPSVFIVSDGRGDTAAQVLAAAAVQFGNQTYQVVRKSEIRTAEQVETCVAEAAGADAVIFYTLVSAETRGAMRRAAGNRLVATVDLLGPAFRALHDVFHRERDQTPGLLYALDRQRFDRMEAIDYTLKHDDGQRPYELAQADVVVVGVSRAAKSSTCFYLAYQGVKAANVPLIPDVPPPSQLLALPSDKVVGLRVNVTRLLTVREARALNMGLRPSDPYLDKRAIAREVLAANRLMERQGWPSLDASYMAVEEIAREIARLARLGQ